MNYGLGLCERDGIIPSIVSMRKEITFDSDVSLLFLSEIHGIEH
jgi:hypothetical protein